MLVAPQHLGVTLAEDTPLLPPALEGRARLGRRCGRLELRQAALRLAHVLFVLGGLLKLPLPRLGHALPDLGHALLVCLLLGGGCGRRGRGQRRELPGDRLLQFAVQLLETPRLDVVEGLGRRTVENQLALHQDDELVEEPDVFHGVRR